ncbi:hypothetical protein [Roseibium sp. Sym1]|uniref:hypothetical protein n=1 Tax=Roseibium sp. Sym1 TaxID=3016006 RepID=UPI0022B3ABB8|nr:hypothetical protein [Roseibium sp. Sym1]
MAGWIGVDLDGTLAHYGGWLGAGHIGEPIAPMVERVKEWISKGIEVRIFTARAWRADPEEISFIQDWAERHIGARLAVTCTKDFGMIELWDDRAVRVQANKGVPCCSDSDSGAGHGGEMVEGRTVTSSKPGSQERVEEIDALLNSIRRRLINGHFSLIMLENEIRKKQPWESTQRIWSEFEPTGGFKLSVSMDL